MALRCLLLDEHVMFSQLLCTVLAPLSSLEVIGRAHNCRQGLELCLKHKPDRLLLNLDLPDGSGWSVAHAAVEANAQCRVVVMSAPAASVICPPPLESRLLAVFAKADGVEKLTTALLGSTGGDPRTQLTARQQQVFQLIGSGAATKQIARKLGLGRTTVESHRKEIARRLGVSGAELVRLAALQVGTWPDRTSSLR
ncbi:MAG: response regulator transcription factor [Cyanobacteriota bacterium]|nr:response regulator transcription factor [Cyanobacteriota bacterium]